MIAARLNQEGMGVWGDVFPKGNIPVMELWPSVRQLGGSGALVFLVNWKALREEERQGILEKLSQKFKASKEDIEADILKIGLPLSDKYVNMVSVPQRFF